MTIARRFKLFCAAVLFAPFFCSPAALWAAWLGFISAIPTNTCASCHEMTRRPLRLVRFLPSHPPLPQVPRRFAHAGRPCPARACQPRGATLLAFAAPTHPSDRAGRAGPAGGLPRLPPAELRGLAEQPPLGHLRADISRRQAQPERATGPRLPALSWDVF